MNFSDRINVYTFNDEIEMGLFNVDGIGTFLYVSDKGKEEQYYKELKIDKDKNDLIKWVIFYLKKFRININSNIEEYSEIIINLSKEISGEKNKFFLSLDDRDIPHTMIDMSLSKLGVKEIMKDPENSRIWIIKFYLE